MLKYRHYLRDKSGIAAVEFAFLAPILMILFIGIVDLGLYLNDKIKIEATARAAVEYMLVTGDEDNVDEDIITSYYDGMSTAPHTVDVEMVCECADGVEVDCIDDICPDEGDYKRRFYNVDLIKTHDTLFVYPGFPSTIEIGGNAKLQLD